MRVLVTGATGFVGSALITQLVEAGHHPRALVRNADRALPLIMAGIEPAAGELRDEASLFAACHRVHAVVHLAAVIREGGPNRDTFRDVNVEGTRNLVKAAKAAGVRRFVMASALGDGDDPSMRYMHSRREAERVLVESGLPHCVLRFSVMYGPDDEFMNVLGAMCKAFPVVPVASPRSLFQPISVDDAARCLKIALKSKRAIGKTLEVGGPERIEYRELMQLAAGATGTRPVMVPMPMPLMAVAVALMNAALPRAPVTAEQLRMLRTGSFTENNAAEDIFGFTPASIREGLGYLSHMRYWDALRTTLGVAPRWHVIGR